MPSPTTFEREALGVILVVDDYADSRAAVRELLEDNGYEVTEAANGQEALNFLVAPAKPRVQLIVLDLQMPVMNGWQFLKLLGSYVRLETIPVLVVSAHEALPQQETHRSIVGCLKVPYRIEELLAVINGCCTPSRSATPRIASSTQPTQLRAVSPTPLIDAISPPAGEVTRK